MRLIPALVVFLAVGLSVHTARARQVLLGGRSAAMGMATLSTGDDGAMPYLNPAGLANVGQETLSLSASMYVGQSTTYINWFVPGTVDESQGELRGTNPDLRSTSFDGMPTSVNYMLHFGGRGMPWHQVAAFSLLMPQSQRMDALGNFDYAQQGGMTSGGGRNSTSVVRRREVYFMGPSYAVQLGEHFKAGLSMFYAYSKVQETGDTKSLVYMYNGMDYTSGDSTSTADLTSHDLVFELGAQFDYSWFHAGLALQPPSAHLGGGYQSIFKLAMTFPAASQLGASVVQNEGRGDFTWNQPLVLRAGIGAKVERRWAVEAALFWHAGSDADMELDGILRTLTTGQLRVVEGTAENYHEDRKGSSIVNVAFGGEYYVTDGIVVRAGGFTDFDRTPNLPDVPTPAELGLSRIDYLGAVLGVGFVSGIGETDLGLAFSYGYGNTVVGNPFSSLAATIVTGEGEATDLYSTIDVSVWRLMFNVAGTLNMGEAADQFKKRVSGN